MTTGLVEEIRNSKLLAALVLACVSVTVGWVYLLSEAFL